MLVLGIVQESLDLVIALITFKCGEYMELFMPVGSNPWFWTHKHSLPTKLLYKKTLSITAAAIWSTIPDQSFELLFITPSIPIC